MIIIKKTANENQAKALLTSYYKANKLVLVEYGCSRGNFVQIGYKPAGDIMYNIQAGNYDDDNDDSPDKDDLCQIPYGQEYVSKDKCTTTSAGGCSNNGGTDGECCAKDDGGNKIYDKTWTEAQSATNALCEDIFVEKSSGIDVMTLMDDDEDGAVDDDDNKHTFITYACAKDNNNQQTSILKINHYGTIISSNKDSLTTPQCAGKTCASYGFDNDYSCGAAARAPGCSLSCFSGGTTCGSGKACDPQTGTCVNESTCNAGNAAHQCFNSHSSKPICRGGVCVRCSSDSDCGGIMNGRYPRCTPDGRCATCTEDSHCGQHDVCNPSSWTCMDCYDNNDAHCTEPGKPVCQNGFCRAAT